MSDKFRILVFDDSEIVLEAVSAHLQVAGYEVRTASSLLEFEQHMHEAPPDVVLVDVKMPEVSGDNVCSVLKTRMESTSLPIILFSALPETELAELTRRSGADGYVTKEAGIDEIIAKIEQMTENILF